MELMIMARKKGSKNRKNTKKTNTSNDSLMLCMLLSTISILAVTLQDYSFTLGKLPISFSIFVLPFILFTSNYITKKYGFKISLQSIFISSLMIVAFLIFIQDLLNQPVVILDLLGNFVSYFMSLVIHLSIYYYILTNFKENAFLIYFNYIFSMIMHHSIYLLFLYQLVATEVFWDNYFISIIIQGILAIGLVMIDKKIEGNIESKRKKSS